MVAGANDEDDGKPVDYEYTPEKISSMSGNILICQQQVCNVFYSLLAHSLNQCICLAGIDDQSTPHMGALLKHYEIGGVPFLTKHI